MMRSMSICHNIQHKQGNGQTGMALLLCRLRAKNMVCFQPAIIVRASETLDVVMYPVGLPLCTIASK
jgi:hypothetical protein